MGILNKMNQKDISQVGHKIDVPQCTKNGKKC